MTSHGLRGRLVVLPRNVDPAHMADFLMIMAANVEDALLQMGAKPGEDYTYRDLVTWAAPYAIHWFWSDQTPPGVTTWGQQFSVGP